MKEALTSGLLPVLSPDSVASPRDLKPKCSESDSSAPVISGITSRSTGLSPGCAEFRAPHTPACSTFGEDRGPVLRVTLHKMDHLSEKSYDTI